MTLMDWQAREYLASHPQPPRIPCPVSTCTPDPDSHQIAFSSDRDGGGLEIYAMTADGTCVTQLTDFFDLPFNQSDAVRSTWSPDGNWLLFELHRLSDIDIYVMKLDGSDIKQLTQSGENYDGRWSPDGTKIVFKSNRDGQPLLYLINSDGSNEKRLTNITVLVDQLPSFVPRVWDYDWSPNSQQLVFTGLNPEEKQMDVYTIDINNGKLTNLTNHPSTDEVVAWWPQKDKILFMSDRQVNNDDITWWTLYAMDVDGTNIQRMVDLAPTSVSTDIKMLGWASTNSSELILWKLYDKRGKQQPDKYILNMECTLDSLPKPGSLPRKDCFSKFYSLFSDQFSYYPPSWSSDAPQLIFEGVDMSRHDKHIFTLNHDGSGLTNLTNCSVHDSDPAWSP